MCPSIHLYKKNDWSEMPIQNPYIWHHFKQLCITIIIQHDRVQTMSRLGFPALINRNIHVVFGSYLLNDWERITSLYSWYYFLQCDPGLDPWWDKRECPVVYVERSIFYLSIWLGLWSRQPMQVLVTNSELLTCIFKGNINIGRNKWSIVWC